MERLKVGDSFQLKGATYKVALNLTAILTDSPSLYSPFCTGCVFADSPELCSQAPSCGDRQAPPDQCFIYVLGE